MLAELEVRKIRAHAVSPSGPVLARRDHRLSLSQVPDTMVNVTVRVVVVVGAAEVAVRR